MGVKIKVDWYDIDQLAKELALLPEAIAKEVQEAQKEDLREVADVLAEYPMQKFGTHYRRTERLKRGWKSAMPRIFNGVGLNFSASIGNSVPYSGFVQGGSDDPDHQTAEFRNRNWKTTDDALKETEKDSQKRLDAAVQKGLDKQLGK